MAFNDSVVDRFITDFFDVEAKGSSGSADDQSDFDGSSIGSFVVPDSQCSFMSSRESDERLVASEEQQVDLEKEVEVVDGTFGKLVVVVFLATCMTDLV